MLTCRSINTTYHVSTDYLADVNHFKHTGFGNMNMIIGGAKRKHKKNNNYDGPKKHDKESGC